MNITKVSQGGHKKLKWLGVQAIAEEKGFREAKNDKRGLRLENRGQEEEDGAPRNDPELIEEQSRDLVYA